MSVKAAEGGSFRNMCSAIRFSGVRDREFRTMWLSMGLSSVRGRDFQYMQFRFSYMFRILIFVQTVGRIVPVLLAYIFVFL